MAASQSDSDDDFQQLHYKVLLLGDGAVGKTSIAYRFGKNEFSASYKQTIGLDCFSAVVSLGIVDVTLSVWDVGGQNVGGKMLEKYIAGTHAVLFVYDITSLASFQNLEDWLHVVRTTASATESQMPHMTLVGNKSDLAHTRAVKLDRHRDFATENGMGSQFVSAKTGDRLNGVFTRVAADLAGVVLSRPDVEATQTVVRAEIVQHPSEMPQAEDEPEKKKKGKCAVQ